ncbi:MAG: hypothetical protein KME13_22440 [Myxacorys californica WJT36-NPBG1]|jgi:hypothetical protein|nr:hypothetical protein [Myxacorys californica WJT36-NPBG1]
MRLFIPTTVKNPCPVGEDTSGKCRTFNDSDTLLCMPLSSKHDVPNGVQFHELPKSGRLEKFAPVHAADLAEAEYQQWAQVQQKKQQQRERSTAERFAKAMPAIARDYTSEVLSWGGLNRRVLKSEYGLAIEVGSYGCTETTGVFIPHQDGASASTVGGKL